MPLHTCLSPFSHKDTSHIGSRPTLTQCDFKLTNHICRDSMPAPAHPYRTGHCSATSEQTCEEGTRAGVICRMFMQCPRPGLDLWAGKIRWRKEWLPTPVFLLGEFHGQRSLVGYRHYGHRVRHDCVTNTFTFFSLSRSNSLVWWSENRFYMASILWDHYSFLWSLVHSFCLWMVHLCSKIMHILCLLGIWSYMPLLDLINPAI